MRHTKPFWRGLFFLFLIAALCGGMALPVLEIPARAAPQMQAVATNLVISELRFNGSGGSTDEFFEIYNPTNSRVNLRDWHIRGSNRSGSSAEIHRFVADVFLEPGQYYLFTHAGYDDSVQADIIYNRQIPNDGGVALIRSDGLIVDQAGMTACPPDNCYVEGTPLTPLDTNINDQSYERREGGQLDSCIDTDNNSADFQLITSAPQNSSSPRSLCGGPPPEPTTTTITSDIPDPSIVNELVTITVEVTGATTVPTGTVNVTSPTGDNCSITLVNGSGNCQMRFSEVGSFGIAARYSGDATHATSSDGTDHQVISAPTATASATATPRPAPRVQINEVAWSGTFADHQDEWIELFNTTNRGIRLDGWLLQSDSGSLVVSLNGHTIPPNGFLLLARRPGTFTAGAVPDIVYGGDALANSNEVLRLINASNKAIDVVNGDGGPWPAGANFISMERAGLTNQWVTYAGTRPVAWDRNGEAIKGTPGRSNWITTLTITTITSALPNPSAINQNVTVSVTVVGGRNWPTGTVTITGASTSCTITLTTESEGKGSCGVTFTSGGSKILNATYRSNNSLPTSSDSEAHEVTSPITRTPTRIPTLRPPPPLIAINEFVPRPGHDWNNDGVVNVGDEYIELLNHGVIDVNLSGYALDDEANIGSTPFRLPSRLLRPGERAVFYGSETGLLLSDGGDGVRLIQPNGQLVDANNYRLVRFPDQSYCRLPDNGGLDDWNENCFPTPGSQNSVSGTIVNPPTAGQADLCPIADTLPAEFVLAECPPFGAHIWNREYWDRNGWYGEKFLPESQGKWNVFVD